MRSLRIHTCFRLLLLLNFGWLVPAFSQSFDANGDSFSDVWQQRFGAFSLQPEADSDSDGFTNLQESLAGTDPFNPLDFQTFRGVQMNPDLGLLHFEFETKIGKRYQLETSTTTNSFLPFGPSVSGNGGLGSIFLKSAQPSRGPASIQQFLWSDISGNQISELTNSVKFPNRPDGFVNIDKFDVPLMAASGFGGSLVAVLSPANSGQYSFFLSSGSSAELFLSSDTDQDNAVKIAEVLSGQVDIQPNEWSLYSSQRSAPIQLSKGVEYLMRVNYLSNRSHSHCQVAWIGPGIDEITIINQDSIVAMPLLSKKIEGQSLFERDYDSGETGVIWPTNTQIITDSNAIDGSSEYVFGDPGNSSAETISLPAGSDDHLYARWQFRLLENHDAISFLFNGAGATQEGPRVEMQEIDDFAAVAVSSGGSGGTESHINVTTSEVYQVEIVAALDSPFIYHAGLFEYQVAPQTFDVYVTRSDGTLVNSARGLSFRDSDVTSIQELRLFGSVTPNLVLDNISVTDGAIDGDGYILTNQVDVSSDPDKQFFSLSVFDQDQDGDGISDWDELLLSHEMPFLFFDEETTPGLNDAQALTDTLSSSEANATVTVSLVASDTAAFEDNTPNIADDNGEIIITRTGSLRPVSIDLCIAPLENTGNTSTVCDGTCCTLSGSAGDEAAEPTDYLLIDEDGQTVVDRLEFAFGEMHKTLTVKAIKDNINEYPETLNLAVKASSDGDYEINDSLNGASIQLIDLPESPSNVAVFTGLYSQDGNAVISSTASGSTTAIINGPRTKVYLTTEFNGLTSNQQDAHVHKSNAGPAPGPIIYAITNVPGAEGDDPPNSDPLLGPLDNYLWDLSESSGATPTNGGAASKQTIIDSLFGQNGETPLYFNLHTVSNPAGEIWSFLNLTGGSITDPGDPEPAAAPGSDAYPQLAGDDLEAEVRRFLNQATFGATESEVDSLLAVITAGRATDSSYHRHQAFSDWIDSQQSLQQSYLLDLLLATDFQHLDLAAYFDPIANPTDGETATPIKPGSWPTVVRSANTDPALWHLSAIYPLTNDHLGLRSRNGLPSPPANNGRRHAHWQMMLNAKDQLRQKTGFALQQILVISDMSSTIRDSPHAAANYQDMLNRYAFSHYRDLLGFVNWNPLMAKWLSSLQNQKGIDLDGDGLNDTSPDENLARENMQLFSIGLFELWPDGTLRLGNDGAPNNTYTNEDIQQFAKIITGQSFSVTNDSEVHWGGVPYSSIAKNTDFGASQRDGTIVYQHYNYPLKMFGEYHDLSVKSFAGTTIDNTLLTDPTLQGIADMEQALDWLAGKPNDGNPDFDGVNSHGTTPAFICRRLIQRFTTSNPSQDYLHRVATAFINSEGNVGQTVKAILLDPEARVPDLNSQFGMKKSPLEGFIQIMRVLGGHTHLPLVEPTNEVIYQGAVGDFSSDSLDLTNYGYSQTQVNNQLQNTRFLFKSTIGSGSTGLQMNPLGQETVFNWYLPDFAPSEKASNAGLVAPEMQLINEQDVIRNINYQRAIITGTITCDNVGGSSASEFIAFGSVEGTNNNDRARINLRDFALRVYPNTEPTATATETSEFLANVQMVNEIDRIFTCGFLKERYPYDSSDDDDPNSPGEDDRLKNPRELIIDSITYGSNDPYDGSNDESNRIDRVSDALFLLISSPEFQIKK